jgi:hypothetical protein
MISARIDDHERQKAMEQGLLYTFSTIAQALGGAFALLSAFVLYRFQLLKQSMHEDARTVSGLWMGPVQMPRYLKCIPSGDYAGVVTIADEQYENAKATGVGGGFPPSPEWDEARERLRLNIRRRRGVADKFKRSALTTGIVMIGSVAVIPWAHPIHCIEWLAVPVLVVGVGGFALCLFQYWWLIKAAVYDE